MDEMMRDLEDERDSERWGNMGGPLGNLTAREQASILGYDYEDIDESIEDGEWVCECGRRVNECVCYMDENDLLDLPF